jgi:hypothetical protein
MFKEQSGRKAKYYIHFPWLSGTKCIGLHALIHVSNNTIVLNENKITLNAREVSHFHIGEL